MEGIVPIACAGMVPAQGELLWIEAEQFDEPGGWVNDPQFIDQMGSPYLLAHGLGRPVKDATTSVTFNNPVASTTTQGPRSSQGIWKGSGSLKTGVCRPSITRESVVASTLPANGP